MKQKLAYHYFPLSNGSLVAVIIDTYLHQQFSICRIRYQYSDTTRSVNKQTYLRILTNVRLFLFYFFKNFWAARLPSLAIIFTTYTPLLMPDRLTNCEPLLSATFCPPMPYTCN